jgi:hypothetical protein
MFAKLFINPQGHGKPEINMPQRAQVSGLSANALRSELWRGSAYVAKTKEEGISSENRLKHGQWVGVGSVCKRNSNPEQIEDVLLAIKTQRSDLRLHGFGLKIQALQSGTVRALLHSSDSMAWSYAARKEDGSEHDPRRALAYAAMVEGIIRRPMFIQQQLYSWWESDVA